MRTNRFKRKSISVISENERRKRKREIILIFSIISFIALLTFAEHRVIRFGADFPVSNTILMFILININLLLLILLIFLVFRNLVKLLYERKRKITGAKLRTRLVIAFITITLLPTGVLFFFSLYFITSSIEFWFNVPIEQALRNSLRVGQQLYVYVEDNNRFFLERIAYQLTKRELLLPEKEDELTGYIQVVQKAFNLYAVEVYEIYQAPTWNSIGKARRIVYAIDAETGSSLLPLSAEKLFSNAELEKTRSVFDNIPNGELTRTIGTVPFGAVPETAKAFVVLSSVIPPDISEDLTSISRGFEEYQQIKLLKEPIQVTYYITISIVASLVLFCAIWFGFYLAKSISIPIKELAEGTRRVADGDLGFTIGVAADDEIGSLVHSFNKMTRDLRTSREQLELSAQILRQQNMEIEERRRYMEIVLKNVSTGVITLDADGLISTINKSSEKMLNISSEDVLNKSYEILLRGQHLNLAGEIMENLENSPDNAVEFPLRLTIDGSPRSFMMRINALKDDAGSHMGVVMVFDDLTELEKAQRMAAWREVARRIAHEVKNPLTPIKLSAQRLKRKYSAQLNEPIFEECTRMIIDHVDLIRNLVNEFSSFARFPTANPQPCELPPIILETVALFREGHPDIRFDINIPKDIPQLNLDRQQIKQAMINLVSNAISALKEQGDVAITLSYDAAAQNICIEVADNGPGISDEDKSRLFEPYFSTKKSGMGLGLTIVSSIVKDHNGKINVRDNQPQGSVFIIDIPV